MAKWYYYDEDGEKAGPVRGRELKNLARQGVITPETILEDSKGRVIIASQAGALPFPSKRVDRMLDMSFFPSTSTANWYYYDEHGKKVGPMPLATLKEFARQGLITAETVIEHDEEKFEDEGEPEKPIAPEPGEELEVEIEVEPPLVTGPMETEQSIFLGKYKILEKIGEGGMGNIFAAWDTELRREVTVKTLNIKGKRHSHFKERFLDEARVTGQLKHPGIIPVHVLDYDDKGSPYYVMQLLEGRTLSQLIKHYHHSKVSAYSPKTLQELLRHFINVCQAIAYAHDRSIVHRDLKPANIMLGGYGETFVLDWGLAKRCNDQADAPPPFHEEDSVFSESENRGLTVPGVRLGTAGYQSPEYLQHGISQPSDDIYALGVMLYYLLCDRLPHKVAKNQRVVFDTPVPPHLINPYIDRQMSAVCLCALAQDKKERYRRADRLADDIQRWLDGEMVSVYRMKRREKVTLFLKKNALWFGATLAAFCAGGVLARLLG